VSLPEGDQVARAWLAVDDRLACYPAGLRDVVRRFARDVISPAYYAGWRHPADLAQWSGLPEAVGTTATVAHLLIYLTLALEDDLLDGEGRSHLSPRALTVVTALLHWDAAGLLAGVAGSATTFWQAATRARAWWGEATLWDMGAQPAGGGEFAEELRLRAGKAAALSVAPAAVLVAAGRSDLLPVADRLLEAIYLAIILLDDLQDWETDLRAGQRNFLVELVRQGRQDLPGGEDVAAALTGGAGERLCAIAVQRLAAAQEGLPDALLAPLRSHADRLIETCNAYADLCRAGARWVAAMLESTGR